MSGREGGGWGVSQLSIRRAMGVWGPLVWGGAEAEGTNPELLDPVELSGQKENILVNIKRTCYILCNIYYSFAQHQVTYYFDPMAFCKIPRLR
jgi:hypothetical protein